MTRPARFWLLALALVFAQTAGAVHVVEADADHAHRTDCPFCIASSVLDQAASTGNAAEPPASCLSPLPVLAVAPTRARFPAAFAARAPPFEPPVES